MKLLFKNIEILTDYYKYILHREIQSPSQARADSACKCIDKGNVK